MSVKSIIPSTPGSTPSYYCTWGFQCHLSFGSYKGGIDGHSSASDVLTEENLTKYINGTNFLRRIRKDLLFMYDLGWDVPFGVDFDDLAHLGAMEVIEGKFPSCKGTPAEKLRKLNDMAVEAGWKGAGVWLPANAYKENEMAYTHDALKKFFTDRLTWPKEAGIHYWKMDYGCHNNDDAFRGMVTELAERTAPGLLVEHARVSSGFNDYEAPGFLDEAGNTGLYANWGNGNVLKNAVAIAKKSHVFRLYDVSEELGTPSVLDRASQLFKALFETGAGCFINCENHAYIGAALDNAAFIQYIKNFLAFCYLSVASSHKSNS